MKLCYLLEKKGPYSKHRCIQSDRLSRDNTYSMEERNLCAVSEWVEY